MTVQTSHLLFIMAGGAGGAAARFLLSTAVAHASSPTFPWGTFVVNMVGSFLIGVCMELFDALLVPAEWRSFLTIGFLGGFTTFSTLSYESSGLLKDGEYVSAFANVAGHALAGIALVFAGAMCVRYLLRSLS